MEELKSIQSQVNEIIKFLQNGGDWNAIGEYLIEEGWCEYVKTCYVMGHKDVEVTYRKFGIALMMVNDLEVIIQYKKEHFFVIERNYEDDKAIISLRFEDTHQEF